MTKALSCCPAMVEQADTIPHTKPKMARMSHKAHLSIYLQQHILPSRGPTLGRDKVQASGSSSNPCNAC